LETEVQATKDSESEEGKEEEGGTMKDDEQPVKLRPTPLSDEEIQRILDDRLGAAGSEKAQERESRAEKPPPPPPPVMEQKPAPPEWAYQFPIGGRFPLNGWFCEILGHYEDDDGFPLGFVIKPLHKTGQALKKVEKEEKRKLAIVKQFPPRSRTQGSGEEPKERA
jgi:hypothetical protein